MLKKYVARDLLDTRFNKPCRSADSGIHCLGLISQPCCNLCIQRMTGPRRRSSSLVITCPKHLCRAHFRFAASDLCFAAISAPARHLSLALSMSDQVPSSDLMGIVSSMTEENQAALTAMLAALRERTALPSLSPLPEAVLPADESSTSKRRLLKTCLSLALKSRPWCRSSTLPGQRTSCISPAIKTKSLGATSSHQSCPQQTLRHQRLPRTRNCLN